MISLRLTNGTSVEPAARRDRPGQLGIQILALRKLALDDSRVAAAAKAAGITPKQVRSVLESLASD